MRERIDANLINAVIFDFDGTLCCGRYFEPLGKASLDAIGRLVFGEGAARWADPWMKGDLTCRDIAVYLSEHLPYTTEQVLSALRQGCSAMTFNAAVLEFARRQRRSGRKTALATANMDVFTETVAPAHGLDSIFDIVLNTADHCTLDKSLLWRKAFDAFGPGHTFSSAVLIDDSPRMVSLFESLGGNAYRYEGEAAFEAWIADTGFMREM